MNFSEASDRGRPGGARWQPGRRIAIRRCWAPIAVLAGVGILTAAVGWFRPPRVPPLPQPHLGQASGPVRRAVERHLDDVRRHPRSATAWGELGSVLYAYRWSAEASAALETAERLDPRNARWPYLRGQLLAFDAPAQALEHYRRAATLCGNEPPAPRLRLARILAEQGRWDDVRRELTPLLAAHPDHPHAVLLDAQAAWQAGDLTRAIAQARRSATNPASARPALAFLATLLNRQGDATGATDAAQRAARAPGSEVFADPFDAAALALREDPNTFSERVHPLLAAGRLDEAEAVIRRLQGDYPDFADTWLAAGRLAYLKKDSAQAEAHFRHHLQLDTNSVQGWFHLGLSLLARRADGEAAEAFGRAVERKPDFGPGWFNRGLALGRSGRRDEGVAAFQQALRHNPEHLETYLLCADLHLQSGRVPAALALLDQAALLSPDDRRLATLRAKAKATVGQ